MKSEKSSKHLKLPNINRNNISLVDVDRSSNRNPSIFQHRNVGRRISNLKTICPQPKPLTRWEIAKYRESKFEIVLKEMLLKGYHRSFSILFNINQERERKRLIEGPDSTRWNLPSLMNHPKLDQIKEYLCMIEDCQRNEDYSNLLTATGFLIKTFGQFEEDAWIVQQFVETEIECSSNVRHDFGYMKALANLTAGINAENNGDYNLAAEHLARAFSMAYSQNWMDSNNQPMLQVCSEHLCQVYLHLACEVSGSKPTQMLAYLKQAHEISKESNLKSIEATCCLELGMVFESLKNIDMAIAYYRGLYEVTQSINDQYNLGLANEAIARCYEKQNNKIEATRYMEKFVAIAERSCNWHEYARACRVLGEMYNRFEDYNNAKIAFRNSYQTTYCLKRQYEFNESKVLNGVAEGNNLNKDVANHIVTNTREPVTRLANFRSNITSTDPDIFFEGITETDVVTFSIRAFKIRQAKSRK